MAVRGISLHPLTDINIQYEPHEHRRGEPKLDLEQEFPNPGYDGVIHIRYSDYQPERKDIHIQSGLSCFHRYERVGKNCYLINSEKEDRRHGPGYSPFVLKESLIPNRSVPDSQEVETWLNFDGESKTDTARYTLVDLRPDNIQLREQLGLMSIGLRPGQRLLRSCTHLPGIQSSYIYISSHEGSAHAFHVEDFFLGSANFLHTGACKVWIIIAPCDASQFELAVAAKFDVNRFKCSQFVRHLRAFITPKLLRTWGIPFQIIVQQPGDLVVVTRHTYHAIRNLGTNIAEAINFWPRDLPTPQLYRDCNSRCDSATRILSQFFREAKIRPFDSKEVCLGHTRINFKSPKGEKLPSKSSPHRLRGRVSDSQRRVQEDGSISDKITDSVPGEGSISISDTEDGSDIEGVIETQDEDVIDAEDDNASDAEDDDASATSDAEGEDTSDDRGQDVSDTEDIGDVEGASETGTAVHAEGADDTEDNTDAELSGSDANSMSDDGTSSDASTSLFISAVPQPISGSPVSQSPLQAATTLPGTFRDSSSEKINDNMTSEATVYKGATDETDDIHPLDQCDEPQQSSMLHAESPSNEQTVVAFPKLLPISQPLKRNISHTDLRGKRQRLVTQLDSPPSMDDPIQQYLLQLIPSIPHESLVERLDLCVFAYSIASPQTISRLKSVRSILHYDLAAVEMEQGFLDLYDRFEVGKLQGELMRYILAQHVYQSVSKVRLQIKDARGAQVSENRQHNRKHPGDKQHLPKLKESDLIKKFIDTNQLPPERMDSIHKLFTEGKAVSKLTEYLGAPAFLLPIGRLRVGAHSTQFHARSIWKKVREAPKVFYEILHCMARPRGTLNLHVDWRKELKLDITSEEDIECFSYDGSELRELFKENVSIEEEHQ